LQVVILMATSSKRSAKKPTQANTKKPTSVKATKEKAQSAAKQAPQNPEAKAENVFAQIEASLPEENRKNFSEIRAILETHEKDLRAAFPKTLKGLALLPPSTKKDKDGKDILDKEGRPEVDKETINVIALYDDTEQKGRFWDETLAKHNAIAKKTSPRLNARAIFLQQLASEFSDSKYDLAQDISVSLPYYDTGYLNAVKVAEVHKQMVLKKFEKYIVSYVMVGSIWQGRATEKSDIDVFIVIDDTDVKRMNRVELKEKLRAIIIGMGIEAGELTGIKNKLHIQIYILTDFWQSIRDANPVIFTFLRDGVALYDRGIYTSWKLLLQQGRIKPSQESIDVYMHSGRQMIQRSEAKLKEIAMEDTFYAMLNPSQAALMLYGYTPATPRETATIMREVLVKKEKLLEEKYVKIFDDAVATRKGIEHNDITEVSGKRVDELIKNAKSFLDRIEKLFEQIQKTKAQESVVDLIEQVERVSRDVLLIDGVKPTADLVKQLKTTLVNGGEMTERDLERYANLVKAKKQYEAGKLTEAELELAKKDGAVLLRALVEISQRKRLRSQDNYRVALLIGEKNAEFYVIGNDLYLIDRSSGAVHRATLTKGAFETVKESSLEELDATLEKAQPHSIIITKELWAALEKHFGGEIQLVAK
jgi:uncharacterized protein (UPF0332 family)/predicted nucleotidyltransferase